jgi:hypothetical protein
LVFSRVATAWLVLDGFGEVDRLDLVAAGEVGDRARDAEQAKIGW